MKDFYWVLLMVGAVIILISSYYVLEVDAILGQQDLTVMLTIQLYLFQILQEEQIQTELLEQQTKLLDHIDCLLTVDIFLFHDLRDCGTNPLNITGVWQPIVP